MDFDDVILKRYRDTLKIFDEEEEEEEEEPEEEEIH